MNIRVQLTTTDHGMSVDNNMYEALGGEAVRPSIVACHSIHFVWIEDSDISECSGLKPTTFSH